MVSSGEAGRQGRQRRGHCNLVTSAVDASGPHCTASNIEAGVSALNAKLLGGRLPLLLLAACVPTCAGGGDAEANEIVMLPVGLSWELLQCEMIPDSLCQQRIE